MAVRPCLDCGRLTRNGGRCLACARLRHRAYNSTAKRARARATIAEQPWCSLCGRTDDLTADHVVPVALGGAAGPLRVLCRSCNSRLGAKLFSL